MTASVLSNSLVLSVLFKKTDLMSTMLLKNIHTCRKFLRREEKNSLERKHEIICFMLRNNFFHKNTVGEGSAPSVALKKCRSAKSDVSKVLFPDIGKITNRFEINKSAI